MFEYYIKIYESRKKVKPDSIPRYFYGALFSAQPLSDILCTKEGAEPYIMAASQRTSQGKHSIYNRIIHYKSPALDLPKCNVVPTHEWVDSISPEPDDINFISDEDEPDVLWVVWGTGVGAVPVPGLP